MLATIIRLCARQRDPIFICLFTCKSNFCCGSLVDIYTDACKVRPGWDIPLNAVIFTLVYTSLLSLILIGSTIAFNIIISLQLMGLLSSYIIAIGCMVSRRFRKEPLLPSRLSLGRAGLAVNIIALCFLALAFV